MRRLATECVLLSPIVALLFHASFNYFLDATGMLLVDTLEPKPGVFPTPGDLKRTVDRAREHGAKALLTAKWSNNKATRYVGKHADVPVVEMPIMVGGVPGADTWIGMHDAMLERMLAAVRP